MLPRTDLETYWAEIYPQPVPFFLEALEQIRTQHALPDLRPTRFRLGRNVVFAWGAECVVKLFPPFWQPDVLREETALRLVWNNLPLATPEPLASGKLGAWGYLVMSHLPGEGLGWDLDDHGAAGRIQLARGQGELIRLLQKLDVPKERRDALAFDWLLEIDSQSQTMIAELRRAGVPEPLVKSAAAYVEEAGTLAAGPSSFLHGDLNCINLTVTGKGKSLEVSGLLDFSDAALGPADHEYISPVMHQFRGEANVLDAFWEAAGLPFGNAPLQQRIMARSLLKYPDLMGRYLERLEGTPVATWQEAAARFCRLA